MTIGLLEHGAGDARGRKAGRASKEGRELEGRGGGPWRGLLWIAWCGLAFFVVFGGVQALFERFVIPPHCESACAALGQTFRVLVIQSRGGPPGGCACSGGAMVATSLPDLAMFSSMVLFLAACWLPLWWTASRDRPPAGSAR